MGPHVERQGWSTSPALQGKCFLLTELFDKGTARYVSRLVVHNSFRWHLGHENIHPDNLTYDSGRKFEDRLVFRTISKRSFYFRPGCYVSKASYYLLIVKSREELACRGTPGERFVALGSRAREQANVWRPRDGVLVCAKTRHSTQDKIQGLSRPSLLFLGHPHCIANLSQAPPETG